MNVIPYSTNALAKVLCNDYTSVEVIKSKNHFIYLSDYFGEQGLNIKTIVIEDNYISKDYLKDYTAYYASCFTPYVKHTTRLHFFTNEFDLNEFKHQLLSSSKKTQDFWENYAGFIVVKPIPIKVIGTTVLKTYAQLEQQEGRKFWGTRNYKVHLFGKEITLNSLAFQEQDNVLSACATSALWTVLHKAAEDYSVVLKTPGEITKDAGTEDTRLFPNKEGLQINQMCRALQSSGLEFEVRTNSHNSTPVNTKYLKEIFNAYSLLGLPIIVLISVPSGFEKNDPTKVKYGFHAISVTGLKQKKLSALNKLTKHAGYYDLIEKIYVHDDQWGPFARVEISGLETLSTPWTKFHKSDSLPPTHITGLIIPVFPKVRISYDDIEPIILAISGIYKEAFLGKLEPGFVWDIKLMFSEDYKKFLIESKELEEEDKIKMLTQNLPKYVWVGTCYCKGIRITDFIFDATGISNAMLGLNVLMYYENIQNYLHEYLKKNTKREEYFHHKLRSEYYNFLIDKTKAKINGDSRR